MESEIDDKSTTILRYTGPASYGLRKEATDQDGLLIANEFTADWGPIWYNHSIDHIIVDKITVIFMDNTTTIISGDDIKALTLPSDFIKNSNDSIKK